MPNPARTLVCSILFLDLAEYSKKSVAEQLVLKQSFNHMLTQALESIAASERVILDTGDGAAIAFLGDPEDALFVALTIRETADLPVRMGVNLGPVRLVKDINGQTNIIGDGINVAQRVMSFAEPGQLLVSRSFYEVASRLSNDYSNLFCHAGSRADKHIRSHEVYSVIATSHAARREPAAARISMTPDGQIARPSVNEPEPRTRDASRPAQIFDAGEHLIVSGYSKASVDAALTTLSEAGCRVISAATRVSDKWIATCEQPPSHDRACKVATLEGKQIVTGPTREAVASKVDELIDAGAVLLGDITATHGVWTAVCRSDER